PPRATRSPRLRRFSSSGPQGQRHGRRDARDRERKQPHFRLVSTRRRPQPIRPSLSLYLRKRNRLISSNCLLSRHSCHNQRPSTGGSWHPQLHCHGKPSAPLLGPRKVRAEHQSFRKRSNVRQQISLPSMLLDANTCASSVPLRQQLNVLTRRSQWYYPRLPL